MAVHNPAKGIMWILFLFIATILTGIIIYKVLVRKQQLISMYSLPIIVFYIMDLAIALYGIQCFKYFATVTEEDMKENSTFERIKIQQLIVFLGLIAGNIFI